MLDTAGLLYAALGVAAFGAALLPRLLGRLPVSMPMVFLGGGVLGFALIPGMPDINPVAHPAFAEHLTEACVTISLMGAGLALNRVFSWKGWASTWRLLAITMPLSALAFVALGWWVAGLTLTTALLLAASLVPTDPVLASEVQVAEPAENPEVDDDEARFALTSEAGLNDGLAFPLVYAAIGISLAGGSSDWFLPWLGIDLVARIAIGTAVGFGAGWLLRRLFFNTRMERLRMAEHAEGFVALAATFLSYGVAELVQGYGFLAVFVCACTIRAGERSHGYHRVLHTYVEQIERLLTVIVLILVGAAIGSGLWAGLTLAEVGLAAAFLLLIRPLTGWMALAGGKTGRRERIAIAFFGVRGVGSVFYVAYALGSGEFGDHTQIWRIATLVIAGSILLHGVTATPAMHLLDRLRQEQARRRFGTEEAAPVTAV